MTLIGCQNTIQTLLVVKLNQNSNSIVQCANGSKLFVNEL